MTLFDFYKHWIFGLMSYGLTFAAWELDWYYAIRLVLLTDSIVWTAFGIAYARVAYERTKALSKKGGTDDHYI